MFLTRSHYLPFLIPFLIFSFSCAKNSEETLPQTPVLIITDVPSFATTDITVTLGDFITAINHDGSPHSLVSQSSLGAFDDTGDFDLLVASESSGILTLPDTAASGDVYYFYDGLFEEAMSSGGSITVE